MELKHQVCTFKQAKILKKEFDLNLKSYFVWGHTKRRAWILVEREFSEFMISDYTVLYPAPSCAELGVLLPFGNNDSRVYRDISQWVAQRNEKIEFDTIWTVFSRKDTEAEVKTDLLIHLLREKIINPEDLALENK